MMQTFSSSAKTEICRIQPQEHCCAQAECFGILLFCHSFSAEGIRIVTENKDFSAALPKLFRRAFGITFDEQSGDGHSQKYVFQITGRDKIRNVMSEFGFDNRETIALQVNYPVIEKDCCKAAFLRGAFLSGGSVTDPSKGYHIELSTSHHGVAMQCCSLIQEIFSFSPMVSPRGGSYVVYLKQSEKIADCLAYLGASVASMGIMEARLEKELKNRVNRRCNCDDANITKVVEAASEQLTAIHSLRDRGILDQLPDKLKSAALARENNPEASLTELAGMVVPPISKPAMSHRLKRIIEISKERSE